MQPVARQDGPERPGAGSQAHAIGAVCIQLQSAHLRKAAPVWLREFLPGPNPFVEISINGSRIVGRSQYV